MAAPAKVKAATITKFILLFASVRFPSRFLGNRLRLDFERRSLGNISAELRVELDERPYRERECCGLMEEETK